MGSRKGIEQGLEQGRLQSARASLLQVLEVRFGSVPGLIGEQIHRIEDLERLQSLLSQSILTDSLVAIQETLGNQ